MTQASRIDRRHMRENFSAHADDYDRYAVVQQRVVDMLSAWLIERAPAEGALLDIGTGTGALAAAIRRAMPERRLVVMDIAHDMTRKARQRLTNVQACDGDARFLPFAEASFAGVVSSSVYQWVDDLPGAFAEVARVLKPGGTFALALFGEGTLAELRNAHRQAVHACTRHRSSHVQNFPTRQDVAAALQSAGLTCRRHDRRMEIEHHPDVPALLRQLKQIGASNAASGRPRGLASRRVMQAMMDHYEEAHRCPEGLPASYEVILTMAEKPH